MTEAIAIATIAALIAVAYQIGKQRGSERGFAEGLNRAYQYNERERSEIWKQGYASCQQVKDCIRRTHE